MSTRREALLALPLMCAALPASAQAPKAGPPKRQGYLTLDSDPKTPLAEYPYFIELRKKGWILDENFLPVRFYADFKAERLAGFAEELVRQRVDVILCNGDLATLAAARATRTIPILFFAAGWPVELGLIDSYARPGRNVTGHAFFTGPEVGIKRLQFLREVAPAAKRLSWLWPWPSLALETLAGGRFDLPSVNEAAAKSMGFETRFHLVPTPQDVDAAFADAISWGAQAITIPAGYSIYEARRRIAELTSRHRLPSAFGERWGVEAGGLLSYGPAASEYDSRFGTRIVDYMDRILRGTPPADLPVTRPSRFELVINMKTAKTLGLTVPQSLLLRADEVIQ